MGWREYLTRSVVSCSLPLVNECNTEMNRKFMKFVHQCLVRQGRGWDYVVRDAHLGFSSFSLQYFEDEGMDLVKTGKLIPQPRHNLVFDYGKVGYWSGK